MGATFDAALSPSVGSIGPVCEPGGGLVAAAVVTGPDDENGGCFFAVAAFALLAGFTSQQLASLPDGCPALLPPWHAAVLATPEEHVAFATPADAACATQSRVAVTSPCMSTDFVGNMTFFLKFCGLAKARSGLRTTRSASNTHSNAVARKKRPKLFRYSAMQSCIRAASKKSDLLSHAPLQGRM